MEQFFQITAAVMVAAIACLVLMKKDREIGLLLTVAVCCMTAAAAAAYLRPVLEFLKQVENAGNLDHQFLTILLKCTGIGLVTEVSVLVCRDVGNEALGKALQMLSAAVILWLSLPLLTALLDMIQRILEEI